MPTLLVTVAAVSVVGPVRMCCHIRRHGVVSVPVTVKKKPSWDRASVPTITARVAEIQRTVLISLPCLFTSQSTRDPTEVYSLHRGDIRLIDVQAILGEASGSRPATECYPASVPG